MKYLSDYIEKAYSKLWKETGSFFAFSTEQFNEQKKDGVKYTSFSSGMLVPNEHVEKVLNSLNEIHKK